MRGAQAQLAERCKPALQSFFIDGPLQRQALLLATHPLGGVGSILTELAGCKTLEEAASALRAETPQPARLPQQSYKGGTVSILIIAPVQRQREPEQR